MNGSRSDEEKKSLLKNNKSVNWFKMASLACFVMIMNGSYSTSVISLQLSGIKSNIFQLNSLRFTVQCLVNTSVICFMQHPLKVAMKHIHFFLIVGIFNLIYASGFYFSSSFMPVGNLDGLLAAFYILTSVVFDFYRKSVSKLSVVVSCVAVVGILLLIQPWNFQKEHQRRPLSPCHYMGISKAPIENGSYIYEVVGNSSVIFTAAETTKHSLWLGYIIIVITSITLTIESNVIRLLVDEYPPPVVLFWVILFQGLVSVIFNLSLTSFSGADLYTFPSEKYCLLFTCLFIIFSGFSNSMVYYAFKYLPVSSVALSMVIMTICMYISQRTFLSDFHPGHANITELFGMGIIIFGTTLLPAIYTLVKKKNK